MSEPPCTDQRGAGPPGIDPSGVDPSGVDQPGISQSGVDQPGIDPSGVEASAVGSPPPTSMRPRRVALAVDDEVPLVRHDPDEIELFMFSAASWLIHRIHFDEPFTTGHDGHKALLVHGPLQGAWMIQAVQAWLGVGAWPRSITYRHLAPAYAGDSLECGGSVTAVDADAGSFDADLWVRKSDGAVTTQGTATFLFGPHSVG